MPTIVEAAKTFGVALFAPQQEILEHVDSGRFREVVL